MHKVQANGAVIPALGFGTWELRGAHAQEMVEQALAIGYRHIDTAQMYGNETEVGAAIRTSGLPRDDIFLTTKVWPDRFKRGDFERSVEESLARLKVACVDLLLLHWPSSTVPLAETIPALDAVRERGLARHVGVSNFTLALLEETLKIARSPIVTNQVEYHPFLSQAPLLGMLRPRGISMTAYCPLARGRVFSDPTLRRIAESHGKGPGQIALRWLVQQEGVIAIPRSSKLEHIQANRAIFDFTLSVEEMATIDALSQQRGRIVNVTGLAPHWDT
jgi:diketogulonate reductase-like aldo/keto reductase